MITQSITKIEEVPLRSETNDEGEYRQKVEIFLSKVKKLSEELNLALPEINTTFETMDALAQNAESAKETATQKAQISTEKAEVAVTNANAVIALADVVERNAQKVLAVASIEWLGFEIIDSELIVKITDESTGTPSVQNGDFIIVYN